MQVKQGKLKRQAFNHDDINMIRKNMLAKEYISVIKNDIITICNNKDKTIIKKYDGFLLIAEQLNANTAIGSPKYNYYIVDFANSV